MRVLVVAEHSEAGVAAATLNTITAAKHISGDLHVLVIGEHCQRAADELAMLADVAKVLIVEHQSYAHGMAENIAQLIFQLSRDYTHILAPATSYGKNIMPRVAAMLDSAQISDVIAIESEDTFQRPIYAGNAIATVKSLDAIKVLTIRTTAFSAALQGGSAAIETITCESDNQEALFVAEELSQSERPELGAARVVISGGRGMGSKENFALLEGIADKLDAAVGASRAAVDAGFAPNDIQVGQTGKIVAPELYIAVGISGAIQHLAGMKDSKIIVAINKDEDAPIFSVADYGLVADLFDTLNEINEMI